MVHRGPLADQAPGLQSQWARLLAFDEEGAAQPHCRSSLRASVLEGQFHLATDKQEVPGVTGAFFGVHLARAYSVWRAPGPFKPQGFRRYPDDWNSSLLQRAPSRGSSGQLHAHPAAGRGDQPQETPRWCWESRLDRRSVLKRTPKRKENARFVGLVNPP